MKAKMIRRVFSEEMKKQIVIRIETEEMTVSDASKYYEVSDVSIYKWVKIYGVKKRQEVVVVEANSDYLKSKSLAKEVGDYQRLVGRQQIRIEFLEEKLNLFYEHFGVDESFFLKKP
jgi:transposase-like protein